MLTLIIDSATKVLYEALVKDDKVLKEVYVKGQNDHAKNIVKVLSDMLNEFNLETNDLTRIVCGIGPGSYTGVRMGVTVAKMIASFQNKELYKISTLKLMASGENNKCLALIDARRANSFGALFDENLNEIIPDKLASTESFMKEAHDSVVTETSFKVDPIKCIKLAIKHDTPHSLEPNYLQLTEAERNLNDKKN
jgi:tRNA threonylcarbamoyladenosine biosynthesis protein TsaB